VGRILNDLKKRDLLPTYSKVSLYGKTGNIHARKPRKKRKKQRRNGYHPEKAGDLMELDTVVYFINGIRRYIITAVDLHGRFAFAYAYNNPSSASATDFLKKLREVAPFTIIRLQTDNGSEFDKHFRQYVEGNQLIHFHTYPRSPKMNAHIERFNRTIQEEFANWHKETLAYDLVAFNKALMDWLLWYNTERPHEALHLLSPLQFFVSTLSDEKSHMWWTRTEI
jgi:transposase InsO family protein